MADSAIERPLSAACLYSRFWPTPADSVIVAGTPYNHPSNSAGLGPAPACLCRYVSSSEEILFHNEPFGESVTERPRTHNAHNHPSGIAEPSHADETLTRTLKQALGLVDVRVLDHFIVAGDSILAFSECGLL